MVCFGTYYVVMGRRFNVRLELKGVFGCAFFVLNKLRFTVNQSKATGSVRGIRRGVMGTLLSFGYERFLSASFSATPAHSACVLHRSDDT